MSSYTPQSETDSLSLYLSRFAAFQNLDEADLTWLAENSKPFKLAAGKPLLFADRLPDFCYCLLSGKGRLLHHDPGLQRPVTLAFCQPGDLLGWAGLARRSPCEWITASTDLQLIGFSSDTFYELEERSSAFRAWLDVNNSPAELMSVINHKLASRAVAEPSDRDVLLKLVPHMKLLPARELRSLPESSEIIHLWNAQIPGKDLPMGFPVDPIQLSNIPLSYPLRIYAVEEKYWNSAFNICDSHDSDHNNSSFFDFPSESHRYSDLLMPSDISVVKGESLPKSDKGSPMTDFVYKGKKLPVFTGNGDLEETVAVLEMLSSYFNVPFRRDIVIRAARELLRVSRPTLEIIGNLSTVMSFVGTITDIPTAQLSRVSFPCIAFIEDQPSIIYDINDGDVKAVLPRYGPVRLHLNDILIENKGLRLLLLTPGRDSQQRKLNFSWFFPQITKYRRSLIEVLVASLVMQLLNLAQPLVMQQIFDKVIVQQNLDTLYTLGLVLLGVSLFQGLISAVRTYLFADTTNRIDIALGAQVIQHLLRLPLRYFDRRPVGELQTRLAELGNIRGFLTGSLLTLVLDSVFSVIYIAVMFVYSGVLTAVTLGVIPLFLGLTIVASPVIRAQLRKAAERNARTQSYLVESLSGVQTIKAQNAENNVRWQWQQRYSGFMSETFKTLMIGVSAGTVGSFLSQLTGLLTLWVGAYLVIQGDLTIGQLIAFRIISGYVTGPLLNLATSWQSFQGVALSMERLSDVVDAQLEGGDDDLDQPPLPPVVGDVAFQDVDFAFNDVNKLVVNRVSFNISSGSFVGIVGRSGSGKSTIMKLLPRLYEPTKGRILIDGYDISKLQLGSVRRQIGIVPQDSLLFEGSIRDNIALTTPEATFEDIVAAARVACAHDFIMEQPQGYATKVGERGSGLSGGQRQRIAIARAVLQRPSLLILDEATSALDYLTEKQVCINLKREFSGSTVFFITHRLSTIKSSDVIIMMESGYLVEQGTHEELLDLKGRYFALFSQQETGLD